MYLDVEGLVTTGVGDLIDSVPAAVELTWTVRATGQQATLEQIETEWHHVKGLQGMKGAGGKAFRGMTSLDLTSESLAKLIEDKLVEAETCLRQSFPDYDSWPADAQLGVLSMAWALGPEFARWGWPHFRSAALAQDWTEAADQCRMKEEGNPGVRPRNDADQILFRNAAWVASHGLPASGLYWPQALDTPSAQGA